MRRLIESPILCACLTLAAAPVVALELPYQAEAFENVTVSGQPSLEQLQQLAGEGFVTVINLRRPGEFDEFDEAAEVAALGMTYVHIPIKNIKSIEEADAEALHAAISSANGPVLLHCTVGARASGLLGIERYLLHGASPAEAQQIATDAHMDHAGEEVATWIDAND